MKKGVLNNNTVASSSIVRSINFLSEGTCSVPDPGSGIDFGKPKSGRISRLISYGLHPIQNGPTPLAAYNFFSELLKMIHRITQKYVHNIKNCIVCKCTNEKQFESATFQMGGAARE